MVKRCTPVEPSALDPHHPLIRRVMRRFQLFGKHAVEHFRDGHGMPPRAALLCEAGGVLLDVCAHIRRSVPRVEYDEAAQQLIHCDGLPIGTLKRPAPFPDLLHPAIESAIAAHLDGVTVDGDADEAAECAPADLPGMIGAES